MMDTATGGDMAGALFGVLLLVLYGAVVIFLIVLSIVFIFKAMGFMKRKNAMDRELNENIQQLVSRLQKYSQNNEELRTSAAESQAEAKPEVNNHTDQYSQNRRT